jgi:hypothetical protein
MASLRSAVLATLLLFAPRLAAQTVQEREPNDDAASATAARLGDTIAGSVNPDDVDYFVVELEAGTALELIAAAVPFCRDFALVDPSGNRLAFGDCMANIDTLRIRIPASGRYLIRVTEYDDAPVEQPSRPYSMHLGTNQATIDIDRVVRALLAGAAADVDAALAAELDQGGNGNGVLDVGDLRAFLRAQGLLQAGVDKWN